MRGRSARRRREEFASLTDQPQGGEPPTADKELARLTGIAAALRSLTPSPPAPRFRQALRRRLVTSAAAPDGGPPVHPPPARVSTATGLHHASRDHGAHRRVAVTVTVLTMATVVVVSAVSVAGALPGDPFYRVKQAAQSTKVVLTTSDQVRGHRQLELAAARLADIRELVERDSTHVAAAIRTALHDMDARTRAGSAALTRAYGRSLDIRPLNAVDAFSRDQRTRLAALLPALPGQVRPRARESLRLVEGIGSRAVTLLARSCRTDASCGKFAVHATPDPT